MNSDVMLREALEAIADSRPISGNAFLLKYGDSRDAHAQIRVDEDGYQVVSNDPVRNVSVQRDQMRAVAVLALKIAASAK